MLCFFFKVSQFGLSHYSKNISEEPPRRTVIADFERNHDLGVPPDCFASRVEDSDKNSWVLNFSAPGLLSKSSNQFLQPLIEKNLKTWKNFASFFHRKPLGAGSVADSAAGHRRALHPLLGQVPKNGECHVETGGAGEEVGEIRNRLHVQQWDDMDEGKSDILWTTLRRWLAAFGARRLHRYVDFFFFLQNILSFDRIKKSKKITQSNAWQKRNSIFLQSINQSINRRIVPSNNQQSINQSIDPSFDQTSFM